MNNCPICNSTLNGAVCENCGFDFSCCYEQHPSLMRIDAETVKPMSAQKREYDSAQDPDAMCCGKCGGKQFKISADGRILCSYCGAVLSIESKLKPSDTGTQHSLQNEETTAVSASDTGNERNKSGHDAVKTEANAANSVGKLEDTRKTIDDNSSRIELCKNELNRLITQENYLQMEILEHLKSARETEDKDERLAIHLLNGDIIKQKNAVTAQREQLQALYERLCEETGDKKVEEADRAVQLGRLIGVLKQVVLKKTEANSVSITEKGAVAASESNETNRRAQLSRLLGALRNVALKKAAKTSVLTAGNGVTAAIRADGGVISTRADYDTRGWKDVVSLDAGAAAVAAITADGRVLIAGMPYVNPREFEAWSNIVAVSVGFSHTVGLKADGTVLALGYDMRRSGKCIVGMWRNIAAVGAGGEHTVGLKHDGTVLATGDNSNGQCNVSAWKNIFAISAGADFTLGLKSDGTVVATGDNSEGQCNVTAWKNIVAISAGTDFAVGLGTDGTVVAVGNNARGQCDVSAWKDVIALSAGDAHCVGLKLDGSVVTAGDDDYGQRSVSIWRLL